MGKSCAERNPSQAEPNDPRKRLPQHSSRPTNVPALSKERLSTEAHRLPPLSPMNALVLLEQASDSLWFLARPSITAGSALEVRTF